MTMKEKNEERPCFLPIDIPFRGKCNQTMNNIKGSPSASAQATIIPLWKTIVLVTTYLVAAVLIFAVNAYIGGAVYIAAIFLQGYGGFSSAGHIPGETRGRVAGFACAWILCFILAAALQSFIPAFDDVLSSFGPGLPLPTRITQKVYPFALLAPLIVGLVWSFWPNRQGRLRIAIVACWICIAVIFLMMGSMYLPIWTLG